MKKIKFLILLTILVVPLSACNKEDGSISDWVGSYHWSTNREEIWHQFITGERKKQSEENYSWDDYKYDLEIKEDGTWFQHNSDKIATSGYSGKVKCYKDYICFVDMPSNYHVKNDYKFSFSEEENNVKFLKCYINEGTDKHGLDYDYSIRTISLRRL